MSAWDDVIVFTLEQEGGYLDDPNDPGGETVWGIARKFHSNETPWPPTRERAIDIYRAEYWQTIHADDLPPAIAIMSFECAVNQGVHEAGIILQETINYLRGDRVVAVDGAIGPKTIVAAQTIPVTAALIDLDARRSMRYAENPHVQLNGHGWFSRLCACYTLCLTHVI